MPAPAVTTTTACSFLPSCTVAANSKIASCSAVRVLRDARTGGERSALDKRGARASEMPRSSAVISRRRKLAKLASLTVCSVTICASISRPFTRTSPCDARPISPSELVIDGAGVPRRLRGTFAMGAVMPLDVMVPGRASAICASVLSSFSACDPKPVVSLSTWLSPALSTLDGTVAADAAPRLSGVTKVPERSTGRVVGDDGTGDAGDEHV